MRRRIFLAALALGGTSAALIVGIAPAVGKQAAPPHVTQVTCKFTLTTEPPRGSTTVVAPQQKGIQDGGVLCNDKQFGLGAIRDHYVMPPSGSLVGNFTQYFDTGTLAGKLRLIPKSGNTFSGGSYQSQNYGGKFNVEYGTGTFHGVKSTQPGTMYCKSPDDVHLSCTETMTIWDPKSSS